MAEFLGGLYVELVDDGHDRLLEPLLYESDVAGVGRITVPAGFVTDYSSVPRFPTPAYALFGGRARLPAVLHDYAYRTGRWTRRQADAVFYEASRVVGLTWPCWPMWLGLRLGGWWAWRQDAKLRKTAGE